MTNSFLICLTGYGCAGVSSVAYGLIAREVERFVDVEKTLLLMIILFTAVIILD